MTQKESRKSPLKLTAGRVAIVNMETMVVTEKRMVFHHPLPIVNDGRAASQIRPEKLIGAFCDIGYQVFEVTGYSKERKQKIKELKRRIKSGEAYDFLYSEFSTSPLITNDPHNLPLHPFLDYNFFQWFKRQQGQVGVFYRDVHWAFDFYGARLSPLKKWVAKALYAFDLRKLRMVDQLFVPSKSMVTYLPQPLQKKEPVVIPPGTTCDDSVLDRGVLNPKNIRLLYAGGLDEDIYKVDKLIQVVAENSFLHLTLIVRKQEWEAFLRRTNFIVPSNITPQFLTANQAKTASAKADFFAMLVEPNEYFNMAMPMKLFNAISAGLPVFCFKGSEAATFIEENKIGWTVDSIKEILETLNSEDLSEQARDIGDRLESVRKEHSWSERAREIAKALHTSP